MTIRRSNLFGLIGGLVLAIALTLPTSTVFAQTPINMVPGPQTLDEDTTLVFSETILNPISVSGVTAGESELQVTLTAANGTVILGAAIPQGLVISPGTGVGDAVVTVTGTIEDINTALEGMSFTPTLDFVGLANLSITSKELGRGDLADPLSDTDVIPIQVLDTTPPAITLLALSIRLAAEDPSGIPISNPAIASFLNDSIAVDAADGPIQLDTDTPSVIPPGTTTVNFSATDRSGNTSNTTATVTVLTPRTLKVRAIVDLVLVKDAIFGDAAGTNNPPELVEELDKFIADIFASIHTQQWATSGLGDTDQFRLDPAAGNSVFDNPADVVQGIFKAIADGEIQNEALITDLLTVVDNLVTADRLLAQVAIVDAQNDPNADEQEIAAALASIDLGDRLIAEALTTLDLNERAALISDAIEKYFGGAWDTAMDSVNSQAASDAESSASQAASDAESAVSQAASDAQSAASQASSDAQSAASQASSDAQSAASQASSDAQSAASQASSDAESAASQASSDAESAASQAASDAESAASQAASDAESAASQAASDAE